MIWRKFSNNVENVWKTMDFCSLLTFPGSINHYQSLAYTVCTQSPLAKKVNHQKISKHSNSWSIELQMILLRFTIFQATLCIKQVLKLVLINVILKCNILILTSLIIQQWGSISTPASQVTIWWSLRGDRIERMDMKKTYWLENLNLTSYNQIK